jgi:small subunit ribosomal protein S6
MATDSKYRVYEAMFLVDSGDAASWEEMTKHLAAILTRNGAEIIGMTRWDERKLTFTVKTRKRGTYVLAFFMLTSGKGITEIERDCRLSEKVIRTLVLKADHFTVADMRVQLGEDMREDIATKLMTERGETETAAAAVAKPTHTGGESSESSERDGGHFGGDSYERRGRRERY